MANTKASVPEVKAWFAADGGKDVTARDLIALKKSPGFAHTDGTPDNATAYDDLAEGIGNGTLTY